MKQGTKETNMWAKSTQKRIICTILLTTGAYVIHKKNKQVRERRVWVKKWLLDRNTKGAYASIMNDLRLHDQESFRKYLRMNTTAIHRACHEFIHQYIFQLFQVLFNWWIPGCYFLFCYFFRFLLFSEGQYYFNNTTL